MWCQLRSQRWKLLKDFGVRAASTSTSPKTHYDTLGIEPTASAKDIKAAYYELSKQYHPDTTKIDQELSAKKFQLITEAYDVLANEETRKDYDRKIGLYEPEPDERAQFRPGDSFINRHYPGGYPEGFDQDYQHFVEFRRRWRDKRRMQHVQQGPARFFDPEEEDKRQFESEYKRRKHGWSVEDPFQKIQAERTKRFNASQQVSSYYREQMPSRERLSESRRQRSEKKTKEGVGMAAVIIFGSVMFALIVTGGR